mmetsp:Transcript_46970/g.136625  ORF Transcript_46970/g.136625 Transcript_46970/m.136625 type:complete len:215 (-) Transcript_46970:915-1559(-)
MRMFKWQYALPLPEVVPEGFTTCRKPCGKPSTMAETMFTKTVMPASYGTGARHARSRRAAPILSAMSSNVAVSGSNTSTSKSRCSLRNPTICSSPGPSRQATLSASRMHRCSGKSLNKAPMTAVSHATSMPQPITSMAASRKDPSTRGAKNKRVEMPWRKPQSSQMISWNTSLFGSGASPTDRPCKDFRNRRCSKANGSGTGVSCAGGTNPASS